MRRLPLVSPSPCCYAILLQRALCRFRKPTPTPPGLSERLSAAAIERTNSSSATTLRTSKFLPKRRRPAGIGVCHRRGNPLLRYAWQSTCKKKSMKTCSATSPPIQTNAAGCLARTDTNIDHRRVPNLQVFFSRKGESLAGHFKRDRLFARRTRHVGSGRQRSAHRNCRKSEVARFGPLTSSNTTWRRPKPKTFSSPGGITGPLPLLRPEAPR